MHDIMLMVLCVLRGDGRKIDWEKQISEKPKPALPLCANECGCVYGNVFEGVWSCVHASSEQDGIIEYGLQVKLYHNACMCKIKGFKLK